MAIKVKSGEIKVGTEYYARGKVITDIDPKEEEKLIALGAAEYAPEPAQEEADADPATGAEDAAKGKAAK